LGQELLIKTINLLPQLALLFKCIKYDKPEKNQIYLNFIFEGMNVVEDKYYDTYGTVHYFYNPGIYLLNGMTLGYDGNQRLGRMIAVRSVEGHFYIEPAHTYCGHQAVRLMIVVDTQPKGTAATVPMILQANSVVSPRNYDYGDRFEILWDRVWTLGPIGYDGLQAPIYSSISSDPRGPVGNEGSQAAIDGSVTLEFSHPIITEYNDSDTGLIVDISKNAIYFVAFGSQTLARDEYLGPGHLRIRFTDVK